MARMGYKNSLISSTTFTDLAGNTGMSLPNAGEYELGDSAVYEGYQVRDEDGSLASMPATDATISTMLICDICGTPARKKGELVKSGRWMVHPECIDEEV